jgi:hypothetical protein
MYCGKDNWGTDECKSLQTGRLHNYFAFDEKHYRLNLVTKFRIREFEVGDANFPEPTHLSYCPYCGEKFKP